MNLVKSHDSFHVRIQERQDRRRYFGQQFEGGKMFDRVMIFVGFLHGDIQRCLTIRLFKTVHRSSETKSSYGIHGKAAKRVEDINRVSGITLVCNCLAQLV